MTGRDDAFRRNLRRLMAERDMNGIDLAQASGLSRGSVYHYLGGSHQPNVSSLRLIREALGCSWDDLLGE